MLGRISRPIRCFARWLFGGPFEDLPLAFGKPMPEIRAFEEGVDQSQHRAHGNAPTRSVRRHERTRPAR